MNKFKKYLLSKIRGKYRYSYQYTSPFGEEWIIYRYWFWIIPIIYQSVTHLDFYNNEIVDYVNELNNKNI